MGAESYSSTSPTIVPEDDDRRKVGELTADHVVPLLSLAVPLDSTPHKRDLIQWTVRVQAQANDAAVEKPKHLKSPWLQARLVFTDRWRR